MTITSPPPPQEGGGHTPEIVAALEECQDKLWVMHFSLKDPAERQAAINACNMASAALAKASVQP